MDQQTTYKTSGAKSAPATVSGPWELLTVKSDQGTYLFRFNATTGDCYYLDVRSITQGWQLVPSGMGISDAGVTANATKSTDKADKVTAGSI